MAVQHQAAPCKQKELGYSWDEAGSTTGRFLWQRTQPGSRTSLRCKHCMNAVVVGADADARSWITPKDTYLITAFNKCWIPLHNDYALQERAD